MTRHTKVLSAAIADGTRPPMIEVIEGHMGTTLSQRLRRDFGPVECIQ
jgi:hypothetical protein